MEKTIEHDDVVLPGEMIDSDAFMEFQELWLR